MKNKGNSALAGAVGPGQKRFAERYTAALLHNGGEGDKAALAELETKHAEHVKASAVAEVDRHAALYDVPEAVRPIIADAIAKDATTGRKILAGFRAKRQPAGAPPMKTSASQSDHIKCRSTAEAWGKL